MEEKSSKKKTLIDFLFTIGIVLFFIGLFYFYYAFYDRQPITLITAFIFLMISIIELLISCIIKWIISRGEKYGS